MGTVLERQVDVAGEAGLHARPAAELARRAARFQADLTIGKGGHAVDAKSVLLLLTLDVRNGDRVTLRACGADAHAAIEELAELLGTP